MSENRATTFTLKISRLTLLFEGVNDRLIARRLCLMSDLKVTGETMAPDCLYIAVIMHG